MTQNTKRLIASCAALIFAVAGMAQEPAPSGFYFGTDLGVSFVQTTTVKSSFPFPQSGKMEFDPGVRFDMALGWQSGSLAWEFETGILANSIDSQGFGGDFVFYQVPLLVNFYYQIPTRSRFRPFVGLGLGGVQSVLEDYDLYYGVSDSAFGFGWQGIVGCNYRVSPAVDLGIHYKYLGLTERSFDSLDLKMNGTHTHSLAFLVSLRF